MAIPEWPSALPQHFNHGSYRRGVADGRLSSPMEAGVAKVRNRFRAPKPVSGTMDMTPAQFEDLENFITDDLDGGVLPFTFPAQPGPGTWLVRFDPGAGLPQQSGSDFEVWPVTLSLEVLP